MHTARLAIAALLPWLISCQVHVHFFDQPVAQEPTYILEQPAASQPMVQGLILSAEELEFLIMNQIWSPL